MTPFQAILAAKRAAEAMEQAKYRVAVARAQRRVDADIAELDAEVARQVAADDAAKASAAHEDQPMADDDDGAMEVDEEAGFSPGPEGDDDNGAAAAPAAQAGAAAPRHTLVSGSYVSGSRVTSAAAAGAATHAAQAARGPRPALPMDDDEWSNEVAQLTIFLQGAREQELALRQRLDDEPEWAARVEEQHDNVVALEQQLEDAQRHLAETAACSWDGLSFSGHLSNHFEEHQPCVLDAGHRSAKWEPLAWAWAISDDVGPKEQGFPGRIRWYVTNKMVSMTVEEFQSAVHMQMRFKWKGPHQYVARSQHLSLEIPADLTPGPPLFAPAGGRGMRMMSIGLRSRRGTCRGVPPRRPSPPARRPPHCVGTTTARPVCSSWLRPATRSSPRGTREWAPFRARQPPPPRAIA